MKRRSMLAGLGAVPMFGVDMPSLSDGIVSGADAKLTQEPFGDLLIYYSGRTEQLKSITAGSLRLKPGMSPHPPHQHPEEEFMVITEGSGEIEVAGKKTRVGPGSMMYCGG
ncbi:MAG TPA: cupin domain-containing protein, partial [Bryobacteraceae bacterium]|nr:cupin domain-containing protein [Bryobacteraceae bacterium]